MGTVSQCFRQSPVHTQIRSHPYLVCLPSPPATLLSKPDLDSLFLYTLILLAPKFMSNISNRECLTNQLFFFVCFFPSVFLCPSTEEACSKKKKNPSRANFCGDLVHLTSQGIGGSVVEFSPPTREIRVRFPANAYTFRSVLRVSTANILGLDKSFPTWNFTKTWELGSTSPGRSGAPFLSFLCLRRNCSDKASFSLDP